MCWHKYVHICTYILNESVRTDFVALHSWVKWLNIIDSVVVCLFPTHTYVQLTAVHAISMTVIVFYCSIEVAFAPLSGVSGIPFQHLLAACCVCSHTTTHSHICLYVCIYAHHNSCRCYATAVDSRGQVCQGVKCSYI